MKRILLILALVAILLCSCTDTAAKSNNGANNGASESKSTVSEEVLPSNTKPAITAGTSPSEELTDLAVTDAPEADDEAAEDTYWSDFYEDLRSRPNGKEVTIFADNTSDCDYSGYKEIGYDFDDLRRSIMVPEDWNGFRFAPKCDYGEEQFENGLTGIPVYDGSLPVKIDSMKREHDDYTDYFANKPMEKSVFFFAEAPWQNAQDFIAENITKYDHETYIDKKGRSMQVYFLDGLPKYACYDDFFNLCVWFNLKDEEQIPIAVNMINSIEVTLSSDGMFALNTAERLGYTITPPKK